MLHCPQVSYLVSIRIIICFQQKLSVAAKNDDCNQVSVRFKSKDLDHSNESDDYFVFQDAAEYRVS